MKKIENSVCLKEFGDLIKAERIRRRMSQAEVAQIAEISQPYYSKIELAQRGIDLVGALKICKALNLDLSEFIKRYI